MATTFTVAGVDLGRHTPQRWTTDGERARITGTLHPTSQGGMTVAAYQLRGIINNVDEQSGVAVVPSSDASLAGYYRVVGGDLDIGPEAYRSYWANFTLELEALKGRASPLIESRLVGALRSNAHSIVVGSTVPWWATPTDAEMDNVVGATTQTRTGEGGSVKVQYTTNGTLLLDATPTFLCPAGDYYDLCSQVEITPDGSTWLRIPGHEIGTVTAASTTGWRLNNKFVRVIYGGGAGLLSFQWYVSGAWTTAKVFKLTYNGASVTTLSSFNSVTILHNAPELVILRLGVTQASANDQAINVDLVLRRGSRFVDVTVTTASGTATKDFGCFRNAVEASTAHTAGIHATAADADGNKFFINTSVAKTNDTTNGGLYNTGGLSTVDFQVGLEPGSASGADTFTNQTYSYFAAVNETMRLARR